MEFRVCSTHLLSYFGYFEPDDLIVQCTELTCSVCTDKREPITPQEYIDEVGMGDAEAEAFLALLALIERQEGGLG